jgi:hypothetical protein
MGRGVEALDHRKHPAAVRAQFEVFHRPAREPHLHEAGTVLRDELDAKLVELLPRGIALFEHESLGERP